MRRFDFIDGAIEPLVDSEHRAKIETIKKLKNGMDVIERSGTVVNVTLADPVIIQNNPLGTTFRYRDRTYVITSIQEQFDGIRNSIQIEAIS